MKQSYRIVQVDKVAVHYGVDALEQFSHFIARNRIAGESVMILTDSGTATHCLPLLLGRVPALQKSHNVSIRGGEHSKSLETAAEIWSQMLQNNATRRTLLVNLGGGIVTDLGGFVASGFQRGIRYVNIPTSLIGQVDAAIGGKTGVNLGSVKNQVGSFCNPEGVFIDPGFLHTLPSGHLRSGLAEAIKCMLTGDEVVWRRLLKHPVKELLEMPVNDPFFTELISHALSYKLRIVQRDFREARLRKVLNFGHTIGHAFETMALQRSSDAIMHGDAVAAGMICATLLSHQKTGLNQTDLMLITGYLGAGFPHFQLTGADLDTIVQIIGHDKKRRNGQIEFTLLERPGKPRIQIPCNLADIMGALESYQTLFNSGF